MNYSYNRVPTCAFCMSAQLCMSDESKTTCTVIFFCFNYFSTLRGGYIYVYRNIIIWSIYWSGINKWDKSRKEITLAKQEQWNEQE